MLNTLQATFSGNNGFVIDLKLLVYMGLKKVHFFATFSKTLFLSFDK